MRILLMALVVSAAAFAAAHAEASDVMSCSYTSIDGSSSASASGDVAVCGPCVTKPIQGACASALDLPVAP